MPRIASENLVIGKGIARAAKHPTSSPTALATGFRDLGNAPSFSVSIAIDKGEHASSRGGVNETDLTWAVKVSRSATITLEEMNADNVALLLLGTKSTVAIASAIAVIETFTNVEKGYSYQLGVTTVNPGGSGLISNATVVTVTGNTPLVVNVDYELNAVTGLLTLLDAGTVVTDAIKAAGVKITYDRGAQKRDRIISGNEEATVALQFTENNPVGPSRVWLFPYVRLRPNGDFNFISDEVRSMEFQADILPMGNFAAVYCDGQPVAA